MTQFKPLSHQEDADYVMAAKIADLEKIEARGIKHVHTGRSNSNYLMLLLSVENGQLQYKSLEDHSLILKRHEYPYVLELATDMFMLKNLII